LETNNNLLKRLSKEIFPARHTSKGRTKVYKVE